MIDGTHNEYPSTSSLKITGKLGEKITDNKELGVLSKKLARIILDVPIEYSLSDFKLSDPDNKSVMKKRLANYLTSISRAI